MSIDNLAGYITRTNRDHLLEIPRYVDRLSGFLDLGEDVALEGECLLLFEVRT